MRGGLVPGDLQGLPAPDRRVGSLRHHGDPARDRQHLPHTADGAVINIYDGLGIQLDTEDWRIEAEWDADGARCFSTNNRSLDHLSCFRSRATSACGKLSHFDTGTLLMSEKP